MSFDAAIANAELAIASAGFSTELWEPEFGWETSEKDASEMPYPAQRLAALQCFISFFVRPISRVWAHLGAEMQAGKTGVINALVRLILKNARKLHFSHRRMFVLTGMSDNAWKKQTRERLPECLHGNVYHNGGLTNFRTAIEKLAASDELSDVLIVIDESHLASALSNRPQKLIYEAVARRCPREKWQENNIRFLTISATDPAKVLSAAEYADTHVIRLQTTSEYQSVESLSAAGRIRSLETFKNINSATAITELKRCISAEFNDAPRYHILRAPYGKTDVVVSMVTGAFPGCIVQKFDAEEKSRLNAAAESGDDSSSAGSMNDINELLADPPVTHTFIVLKNMLYAAKTLDDTYVGVLWDRLTAKDDTSLQSLLGRACGYGKNTRTVVYTSSTTVSNYIRFWRELCSDPRMSPVIPDVPIRSIMNRMVGISARNVTGGVLLTPERSVSHPLSDSIAFTTADIEAESNRRPRQKANEDNFVHTYNTYSSFAEAKAVFRKIHTPKMEDGFYLTSTTGKAEKLAYNAVVAICEGKKTANLPWSKLTVGKSVNRLYVGYRDVTNSASAVFVVRTLTRIA